VPGVHRSVFDRHTHILRAECACIGQAHFEGTERAVSDVVELIGYVEMNRASRGAGGANLRLAIVKMIAGAERMHAAGDEECADSEGSGKENTRACFARQDEPILPGWKRMVKT
jgi:hypothetical protein